jgi:hypothetical protein
VAYITNLAHGEIGRCGPGTLPDEVSGAGCGLASQAPRPRPLVVHAHGVAWRAKPSPNRTWQFFSTYENTYFLLVNFASFGCNCNESTITIASFDCNRLWRCNGRTRRCNNVRTNQAC